jgi:hypothetical protein
MPKGVRYLLVAVLALIVPAVAFRWWARRPSEANDIKLANWGSGDLKASEEAYYRDRVSAIIDAWAEMGRRAEYDRDGRLREPYRTCLVIDCGRREIRIEEAGHVLEEYRSELPRQMTWTLYHDDGRGARPLGPVGRLKYRGIYPHRQYPEMIWLVGQNPSEFFAFHFSCREQGRSLIRGRPFRAYQSPPARKEGVEYYASILASDAEYEQSRLPGVEAATEQRAPLRPGPTGFPENRAAWSRVRQKLYQVIEGQVIRRGFHLRQLQVVAGPDFSAAHAEMQVSRDNLLRDLLGWVSTDPYLLIDYLGDDVWYARLVPNPQRPIVRPDEADLLARLPLEFLVAADQEVPSSARPAWIEKGRAQQKADPAPPPEWTATLSNGAIVTLLGVCESPSTGRPWWGPDGRPLDYAPCFADALPKLPGDDRRLWEIAWRVRRTDGNILPLTVRFFFEDSVSTASAQPSGRYGVVRDVYLYRCGFAKAQEKATLRVGVDLGNQGVCSVRFKNISLVPGTNPGFEIVLGEGAK